MAILDDDGAARRRRDGRGVGARPVVVDGYLDNPEANAASFRDGWFRTGDLGMLSARTAT